METFGPHRCFTIVMKIPRIRCSQFTSFRPMWRNK